MPWLEQTAAVLEAWYPGQKGGEAIAEILSGAANPSGRLPVTFPIGEDQLPHPKIQGDPNGAPIGPVGRGGHYGAMFTATYDEGAAVGYKWFFERGAAAIVSVRLRAFLQHIRIERAGRERQRPNGDGERDSAQFGRARRYGDSAILSHRTERREHSAAPGRVGSGRSQARRTTASRRLDRPAPACDVRRGRQDGGESNRASIS